jgi:hypothetical protein
MSLPSLSNPTIEVNDEIIGIIPNSFIYKEGSGDKDAKAESAGGDAINVVVTENAETKISMSKFKLYLTATNLQRVKDWSANLANTIRAYQGEINVSFRDMVVTTEPERAPGADGELEIEFKGAPVS